jgi:hypothetical protein
MPTDEELRAFERNLQLNPPQREWIEGLRAKIEKIERLIEQVNRRTEHYREMTAYPERLSYHEAEVEGALREIERLTVQRQGLEAAIRKVIGRAPRLARIAGMLGGRAAQAAQFAGKALTIVGDVLQTFDPIFIILTNPSDIAVPYRQYDLVETYLVNSGSGDEVHCYFACVYEHTHDVIDDADDKYPPLFSTTENEELVIMHEYPCDRPPSPEVLSQACQKTFYVQAE